MNINIRWIQRFSNYKKALAQLEEAILLNQKRKLSKLEEQGLIQAFKFTYELALKILKDFLQEQGNQNIYGSRDAIQEAFKVGFISNGEDWMEMFRDRNKTSHAYNQQTADEIANAIYRTYFKLLKALDLKMEHPLRVWV